MMFGAPVSIKDWLLWNQLPVTLGNIISGALFTGLALYATYREKQPGARYGAAENVDNSLDNRVALAPATAVMP
jgi:hypothetical protein